VSPHQEDSVLDPRPEQGVETETNVASAKKAFVEPTISLPVDVLEATAFFQGPTVTSGSTD
jgi:hypothetical protein